jgi:predicted phosphodiesterase
MVNFTDIVIFYSGSGRDTSIGGAISAVKLQSFTAQNLYSYVTPAQSSLGIKRYKLIYIKNNHPTEQMNNVVATVGYDTKHAFDSIRIGKGQSGLNGTEPQILNELTPPSSAIQFFTTGNYQTGLFLGNLPALARYPIWIELEVDSNDVPMLDNNWGLDIYFDPPTGSSGGGTGGGSGSGGGGTGGGSGGGSSGGGSGGGTNPPPPPPPVTLPDFVWAAAGDWTCGSEATRTRNNIQSRNPKFVVFLGDNSYKDSWECYLDLIQPIMTGGIQVFGNHDREEGTPQPEMTNAYLAAFGLTKTYYSVIKDSMLFVVIDNYTDFEEGSVQYNFIKTTLETQKNNASIKWRVVLTHEPIFTSRSNHDPNTGLLQNNYPQMFLDNKVDLVLCGHNHNYQRSYPITDSEGAFSTTGQPNFTGGQGVIYSVVGSAGRAQHDMGEQADFMQSQTENFGYAVYEMTLNQTKLSGKFYTNSNNTLFDQWSITKT